MIPESSTAPRTLVEIYIPPAIFPSLKELEFALVSTIRAFNQAVPRSLPVSLALKRFQPGLRGLEVIALLGRITTALGRALPQSIREGTSTYKDV